ASQPATRTVSASPQAPAASPNSTPAPGPQPSTSFDSGVSGCAIVSPAGSHAPPYPPRSIACHGSLAPPASFSTSAADTPTGTAVHADGDLLGAHRLRGEFGAVQHQVRRDAQQQLVLGRRGLALGAVDDDVRAAGLGTVGGHRGELPPGREPGAAAPAQPGLV